MKPEQTKRIYESACRSRRLDPMQEEGASWHHALRTFEARDVETALLDWNRSTERDSKGDLLSKWLPAVAQLVTLTKAAQRKRETAAREPQDMIVWRCSGQVVHTCTGFVARGASTGTADRKCHCGAELHLVLREAA